MACLPCTEVNFACRVNHDPHIFTRHKVILDAFNVKEVGIWSPKELGGIRRHVEWCGRIMLESWIVPPLAEKNIHGIFLLLKKENADAFYTEANQI